MNSLHYVRIHTLYEFMLCWCNSLFVGALIYSSSSVQWRQQNSHVCLWTCTNVPWVARRRSVCSSPALLAAPLSNGGSHCQGSWIACLTLHEFIYQHECRLFAMQGQWISWLPMLDNLVTASGSPGFTFQNLLSQGHYCWGIDFERLWSIW